jgi:CrcB protein
MLRQFAAVGIGAALGAWLRWGLGAALNPLFPTLPLGTLTANLFGGFAMGVAMELATRHAFLSPEARLFVITGFLGGLTTFSAFSAEATTLALRGEWLWGAVHVGSHVVGSIVLTLAGLWLARSMLAVLA